MCAYSFRMYRLWVCLPVTNSVAICKISRILATWKGPTVQYITRRRPKCCHFDAVRGSSFLILHWNRKSSDPIESNRDCPSKKLIANFFSLLERIGLVSIDGSQLTLFSLRNEIIWFDYEASISWELKILIRLLNLADEWTVWRRDKLPTWKLAEWKIIDFGHRAIQSLMWGIETCLV